jgi:hypothetical protein
VDSESASRSGSGGKMRRPIFFFEALNMCNNISRLDQIYLTMRLRLATWGSESKPFIELTKTLYVFARRFRAQMCV